MYTLKVLSGKNSGNVYPLYNNETIIGRSPSCDIQIPNPNISKQHAKIIVDSEKAVLADLNSTNGSFVNGVQVEVSIIEPGDKLSFYDSVLEFRRDKSSNKFQLGGAVSEGPSDSQQGQYGTLAESKLSKILQAVEDRVMPPFYMLMEKMDFKFVVSIFAMSFIILTALLSTFPLMNIIQNSVETESKNRARSLAKLIATTNRDALRTDSYSSVSVALGFKEPGVKKALIIRQENGEIIAPAINSGSYLQGPIEGKVNTYRKITDRPHHTFKASSNIIISMYPIKFYSNAEGLEITKYYAVIIYNAKVLSFSNAQTLNLLVQTVFLAFVFGLALLYVLINIIERPLKKLKLDLAYAGQESGLVETKILSEPLKDIYISVNSILNQSGSNEAASAAVPEADRSFEIQNLVEQIGYACIIISNASESVLDYNPYFEELTNLFDLKGSPVSAISDNALQQNLQDLMERVRLNPESISTNDFEFGGIPHLVKMQAVYGSVEISYFVCTFVPSEVD